MAFELVEVRTGPDGLKSLLRNGLAAKRTREAVNKVFRELLDAFCSEKRDELRRNETEIRDDLAKRELNAFLER